MCIQAQKSLPLDSCLKWAKESNSTLRVAQLDIDAAREVQRQVLTKFFPQVTASAFAFHAMHPLVDIDITKVPSTDKGKELLTNIYDAIRNLTGNDSLSSDIRMVEHGYSAQGSLMQPIYMGGRIVNGYKLSKLGVEAAARQAEMSERDVLQQVEETYWMLAGLQAKRQTIQAATSLLDTIQNMAQHSYEAGVVTQNDMLRVQLKHNELYSQQLQLENGIDLAGRMLAVLIGKDYAGEWQLDSLPLSCIEMPLVVDSISVDKRPEAALLDMQVRAEKLKKKMTLGEALPMVGLGATGGISNYFDKNHLNMMGLVFVSVPLTQWWETAHKIREHNIRIEQAEAQQTHLTQMMTLENTQVYNKITESIQLLEQHKAAQTMAADNYRLALLNYEAGLSTMTELLEAQTLLLQADNAFTDEQIQLRNNKRRFEALNR